METSQNLKLPRGIQKITRRMKDGTTKTLYRVQISRKRDNLFVDQLLDDPAEALELLRASISKTGRGKILLLQEMQKEIIANAVDQFLNWNFEKFCEAYVNQYLRPRIRELDDKTPFGKLKLRNFSNTLSFYKTINNTEVKNISSSKDLGFNPLELHDHTTIKFGQLKPSEITTEILNDYIKTRLQKVKASSLEREITHISNVFRKLPYLDTRQKDIVMPTYDRDLIKQNKPLTRAKPKRISDDQLDKIQAAIEKYQNPEMGWIISLAIHTAMRRSELILLTWDEVNFEDHKFTLMNTKNNTVREIYITKEAREILEYIKKHGVKYNDNRVFGSYSSVAGFEGSFTKWMEALGLDISFHRFRKEAISRMIMRVKGSSLLLSEILGIANVESFAKKHNVKDISQPSTEQDVLDQIGHGTRNTTKRHYFSLKFEKP